MRLASTDDLELHEGFVALRQRCQEIWNKALALAHGRRNQLRSSALWQERGEQAEDFAGAREAIATDVLVDQVFQFIVT